MMLDQEEVNNVIQGMITYGGSFVKSLGKALQCADHLNQMKIKDAFPEYWKQYVNMMR